MVCFQRLFLGPERTFEDEVPGKICNHDSFYLRWSGVHSCLRKDIATCFIRRKEPYKTQNADFLNSMPEIWNKARPPTRLTVGS